MFWLRQFIFHLILAVIPASGDDWVFVSLRNENKIGTYLLDSRELGLSLQGKTQVNGAPGAMCVDPEGKYLYLALKGSDGLASFRIGEKGELVKTGESRFDANASYLSLHPSGQFLFSAYFTEGTVRVHKIGDEGEIGENVHQTLRTDERAHAAVVSPDGSYVYIPHTKPNSIHQLRFEEESGRLAPNDPPKLQREEHSGPRHLWFHPKLDRVYGSDEQGGSVTMYRFSPVDGTLKTEQTLSTLPDEFSERNSCSDIEVHPSGEFVYVANRGHNSIASYAIDPKSGALEFLNRVPVEPFTRSFNIAPDGKSLVAAGQKSGTLLVFRIAEDGSLNRMGSHPVSDAAWWVQIVAK